MTGYMGFHIEDQSQEEYIGLFSVWVNEESRE
jgi:hypothetical protein